jgi:hypothetical protein
MASSDTSTVALMCPWYHAAIPAIRPAAADRHEKRGDIACLLLKLQGNGTLTQQRLFLIEGVNGHGARFGHPGFARRKSVGVALSRDRELGAVSGYLLNFRGRGDVRGENPLR